VKVPDRTFTTVHAEPGARPLWIGLMGPSGGGKTFSALRLAKGIQSVIGGAIEFIDTESGRGKHYAEMFDYQYTAFPPPHGSLDYLAAIEHAVRVNKSKIVIIDSLSHEHEGEGGMIDWQEAEVTRMAGDDWKRREAVAMLAWTKPKQARKQLLRAMVAHGTDVVFILCFRADESSKPVKKDGKTTVVQMGFMPIAGKPFVYECTVCALLMPGANGVPTWNPENVGERMMRKLPEQFKEMFAASDGKPMSEEHGATLAKWSLGGAKPAPKQAEKPAKSPTERAAVLIAALEGAPTVAALDKAWRLSSGLRDELRDPLMGADPFLIRDVDRAYEKRKGELSGGPIVPEVISSTEPTERLLDLATRARSAFTESQSLAEANKALEELSEGGCKDFNKLPKYLADTPAFESVLVAAMEGA